MAEAHAEAGEAGVARYLPALASALATAWFAAFLGPVSEGRAVEWATPWIPAMGVEIAFRLDGLGLAFALLVTGIGALVLLYTAEYFRAHPGRDRLLTLLVLFEISMLGLVVADDALTLFVFWEATTVTSFLLIGFDHEKADARAKAIQALIVTGFGGLALLAGLLLLGDAAGTWRISRWAEAGPAIREGATHLPIFILVMLGCFTKSAQIPFHFWLPNAMAAPTPVSAYLHSATMVKAGIYLLARLSPTLGGTDLWMWTLTLFGGATMVLSSIWALRQTDLKLGLAFTTVMGLGTLTMFLGVGGEAAAIGAAVFLLVHAFYKASLFLCIGILDKKAGSREADALSGLGAAMPLSFAIAALAAASMAGLPPFFGFIAKEELYASALAGDAPAALVVAAAVLANAMMIAIAGAVGLSPFLGPRRAKKAEPADPHWAMWLGPGLLAAGGLLFGLAPGLIDAALIGPIAASILGRPVEIHLYLWHGVNLPLILSLATFALGGLLYWRLRPTRERLIVAEAGLPSFEGVYEWKMARLDAFARAATRALQSGLMTRYLQVAMGVLALMLGAALLAAEGGAFVISAPPPALFLLAAAMVAAGALVLPFTAKRFLKITALGVVGAGTALIFATFGAIDVAITQLMVETLVVVIIAVALLKLPGTDLSHTPEARRARRWNAVIATALGLGTAGALAAVLDGPLDRRLTDYFEATSVPVAHGRNIVNVILVDFRALDTMGEIAVVVVAGLSALALLAARARPLRDQREEPEA